MCAAYRHACTSLLEGMKGASAGQCTPILMGTLLEHDEVDCRDVRAGALTPTACWTRPAPRSGAPGAGWPRPGSWKAALRSTGLCGPAVPGGLQLGQAVQRGRYVDLVQTP